MSENTGSSTVVDFNTWVARKGKTYERNEKDPELDLGLYPYHQAVALLMVLEHDKAKIRDNDIQLMIGGLRYAVDEAHQYRRTFVYLPMYYWERVVKYSIVDVLIQARDIAIEEMSKHGEMV